MVINEGLIAVKEIKEEFPPLRVLADLKIMDAGAYEVMKASEAGADIITVLGATKVTTIMQTPQYVKEIIEELNRSVDLISDEEAERLVDCILESKKVFVAGAGRSGFMVKSFAIRMMHMGLDAYVVSETVTPNLEKKDILIIGSGSGETKSLDIHGRKSKKTGCNSNTRHIIS